MIRDQLRRKSDRHGMREREVHGQAAAGASVFWWQECPCDWDLTFAIIRCLSFTFHLDTDHLIMSIHDNLLKRRLMTGLPPRAPVGPGSKRSAKDYSPLSWDQYFESQEDVLVPECNATFRVYKSGFNDPEHENSPILMLLHGGGYSGLSWSVFAKSLTELIHVKIVAVDMRGHGSTHTDNDADLSADTLAKDAALIYKHITSENESNVILMGHSVGGAIAVRSSLLPDFGSDLSGLIVIDVVEGTALDALQSMQSFLRGRPKQFECLEKAIEWSVRSGQTKNLESARISMPSQLKPKQTSLSDRTQMSRPIPSFSDAIREEEEEADDLSVPSDGNGVIGKESAKLSNPQSESEVNTMTKYEFRVDLSSTEKYWRGWFEGLSQQFLDSPSPAKMLLLAGIDTLDRELTIGQMQGKFQMQVLPECGHAVHEDVPDKVAEVVATFLVRNRLTIAKQGSEFVLRSSFPGC